MADLMLEGWFLPKSSVNKPQTESIEKMIKRTKHAHFVNVRVRINGQWEEYEADWIKYLQPHSGFPNDDVGWKLAMRIMESGLYQELDDDERAVCDVIIRRNPHIYTKRGNLRKKD